MNFNDFKNKLKNRKPWSEKKKALLKGLLFGFLAGGLATITAVGVVGCAMTKDKAQENEPTRRALIVDNAEVSYLGTSWTFVDEPNFGDENFEMGFTANEIQFAYFVSVLGDNGRVASYKNVRNRSMTAYSEIHGWSEGFQTITLTEEPSSYALNFLQTWATTDENPAVSSSSEGTSAESTSAEQSSESGGAASSVENSTIEEVSKSFALQFSEINPFSAWAVNPSNEEPASNYDSGAPWLLYTGNPSSATMGSVSSKYSIYNVGAFYVDGNPSQTFDAIAITTLTLSPDNSFVVGGASEAQLVGQDAYNKGAFIVANAYYLNTAAQSRVKVMDFATTSAKLGSQQVNALTGPAWLNVGFRNIVCVGNNSNLEINGYTAPAAWWLKNNALSSSAAVATMLLGNGETGVFGLLASAFSGIGNILGIAIIPGLTIGTLMFIPLVVIVIFAIIKILNK